MSGVSTENRKTRILLVDDHPMVRERLAEVIHRERDLIVCGEADDHRRALEVIGATHPDLVIVDLTLKESHGLDLIKDLRLQHPSLLILVVSMHDESLHAERVIRAGAHGYITKQEATRKVMQAIRMVLEGNIYLSEKMTARLTATIAGRPRARTGLLVDTLTDRELRVFELLGQGHSTRHIAEQLHLDMRTVETYRARIKDKLQLKDGNDLLQHAIRWAQSGGFAS
ncbi:MAG TPA: response regulator transcription factor [Bacillota bacterium]|nr:response regulator transcription factor [Bacillota bacterium]